MSVPCYVITIQDDFPNRKSLERIGLNPVTFKGVNAKKDEHLKHLKHVHPVCQKFCPRGTIGCGLSHILLAQKLYDANVPIALILEDDAYPKVSEIDFEQIISSVPEDWEMIKLHCDMYCKDGTYDAGINASTGAYLINRKGMKKLSTKRVIQHIDLQLALTDMKMYKSMYNIFATDENASSLRETKKVHWGSYFVPRPTSGEKNENTQMQNKMLRIPGTNIELTVGNMIDGLSLILLFILFYTSFSS
jgi:GR25 family glycosyltransferase involved in LPS biosynthesis